MKSKKYLYYYNTNNCFFNNANKINDLSIDNHYIAMVNQFSLLTYFAVWRSGCRVPTNLLI